MVTIMVVMYVYVYVWGENQTGAVTKKLCALMVQIICHLR